MTDNTSWQARRTITRFNMGNPHGDLKFAQTITVKLVCGHAVLAKEVDSNGFSWCEVCQVEQVLSNDA